MHCVLPLVCIPVPMCRNVQNILHEKHNNDNTQCAMCFPGKLVLGARRLLVAELSVELSVHASVELSLSVHTNHLDPRRSRCWRRTLLCWEKTYFSLAFTKRVHLLCKKHLCTKSGDLANTPNLFTHPQPWYMVQCSVVHPPTAMVQCSPTVMVQCSPTNSHGTMYCIGKVLIIIC